MSREAHVRICESLGVKFPWATRLFSFVRQKLIQHVHRTPWTFRNHSQLNMEENKKQKAVWSVVIEFEGRKQKREPAVSG